MTQDHAILRLEDLRTHFVRDGEVVKAVDGVSFTVGAGETVAVVGESGSGKSVTSLSIMRLLDPAAGRIAGGRILFNGQDLASKSEREMRRIRGNEISMIFQEPMTSLNPVYTVGEQICEAIRIHQQLPHQAAFRRAVEMLELVGIPEARRRADSFPHQMSGGMRQRVMIAMALSCNPKLLIADEPTTALDVTIQAQILDLMRRLQREFNMAILFITHDLGVVAEIADRVVVMYAGQAVEQAGVQDLFANPRMPYTAGLMRSTPRVNRTAVQQQRLYAIPGSVPSTHDLPTGCRFAPRCAHVQDRCRATEPELENTQPDHAARCLRWRELDLSQEGLYR